MKTFPPGLDTLLATGTYVFADLYDFTLMDGSHLYYTTADTDVNVGTYSPIMTRSGDGIEERSDTSIPVIPRYPSVVAGNTYTSKGPYFDQIASQSRAHWKAGLDLDTWTIIISPSAYDPVTGANYPATIFGQPWMTAVRVGAIDGAVVDIHRAYWAAWPARPFTGQMIPDYVLLDLFAGRVAAIDCSRTAAVITINSWVELLQRPMPRNIYSASCRWTLFDAGCQLARASFAISGTVISVTSDSVFTIDGSALQNYYELGMLTFKTGANTPFSRSILSYSGTPSNIVTLRLPMPYQVSPGDTFTIYPGCDKTQATCHGRFNNLANFGGFPYIPVPESAI